MSNCRDCHQAIMFVRIEDGGKAMPVDPFPDPDGNVIARFVTPPGGLLGHVAHKGEPVPEGWRIYMPHFATCPNRRLGDPAEPVEAPAVLDPEPTLFDTTERETP